MRTILDILVKQTITLSHLNGDESTIELVVDETNPIDDIELSEIWEEQELTFDDDRTLN